MAKLLTFGKPHQANGFNYDLLQAMEHGNFLKKTFHTSRKNFDEYSDVPFSSEKLLCLFPKVKIVKKGAVYFWSDILAVFQKL